VKVKCQPVDVPEAGLIGEPSGSGPIDLMQLETEEKRPSLVASGVEHWVVCFILGLGVRPSLEVWAIKQSSVTIQRMIGWAF
jgi:hypothetical protein